MERRYWQEIKAQNTKYSFLMANVLEHCKGTEYPWFACSKNDSHDLGNLVVSVVFAREKLDPGNIGYNKAFSRERKKKFNCICCLNIFLSGLIGMKRSVVLLSFRNLC